MRLVPHRQRFERAYLKFLEALRAAGFQAALGVRLGDGLRALGLPDAQLKGVAGEWITAEDHPVGTVDRMSIERLRERIVKAGLLINEKFDQFLADIHSPEFHAITGIHCAAWGGSQSNRDWPTRAVLASGQSCGLAAGAAVALDASGASVSVQANRLERVRP